MKPKEGTILTVARAASDKAAALLEENPQIEMESFLRQINEEAEDTLARTLKDGTDHYVYEGIAWYAPANDGVPVYRFFDRNAFNHYYTSSTDEYQDLSAQYLAGTSPFRYEGIGWNWYE